jgi:serine phosphatase RsbU (regulator of sigma subunit)
VGDTTLYHLTHLAVTLSEALHVEDVVDLAVDQMVPGFGVDAVAIAMAEDGRLRIAGQRGHCPETVGHHDGLPLSATAWPSVRALDSGEAAFYATPEELRQACPEAPPGSMASWAFLPLVVSGRPLGVLDVAHRSPHTFSRAERATLASLAGIVAQALERARLYDAQHTLAHSLQSGLLPHALPRIPGLEVAARYRSAGPGTDIGGDFYDLIAYSPTSAVAVIGDVQGHNSAAAALMGQVRTAVHAFATLGSTPGALLAGANNLLTELDSTLFASCLVAQVDLRERRGLVASAGHPPPLLRRPDGSTQTIAPATGLLLGIDADSSYPTEEFALPDHCVLALYTDGLVERPGVDIDDAIAALGHCLAGTGPDDLEAAADALVRHSENSTPSSDDLALLLLRPDAPEEGPRPDLPTGRTRPSPRARQ